jgi:hypothetical protein
VKKILRIVVLGLLLSGNAYADLNGYGEIKLNQFNVNEFEHYLSDGIHDKNGGAQRAGKGLVFAISLDGADSGYYYCFQGRICEANSSITDTISYCQRNAKKHSGEKKKCRIFAKKRTIVWDGLNKKVPRGVNVRNFLDELGLVSHEVAPTNIDEEQLKQLKSLLDLGVMTQEEYDEAIKAIQ